MNRVMEPIKATPQEQLIQKTLSIPQVRTLSYILNSIASSLAWDNDKHYETKDFNKEIKLFLKWVESNNPNTPDIYLKINKVLNILVELQQSQSKLKDQSFSEDELKVIELKANLQISQLTQEGLLEEVWNVVNEILSNGSIKLEAILDAP